MVYMNNAQILLNLENILNDMDTRSTFSDVDGIVYEQLKKAWRVLAHDPEVQAVFSEEGLNNVLTKSFGNVTWQESLSQPVAN